MNNVLKLYWSVLKPRWFFFLICFVVITNVVFNILDPFILRKVVDALEASDADLVWYWFWFFLIIISLRILSRRTSHYLGVFFVSKMIRSIDNLTFKGVLKQSIPFFENTFTGSIVKQISRFKNSLHRITDIILIQMLFTLSYIVFTLFVFYRESALIGTVFLIWTLLFIGVTTLFSKWKFKFDLASSQADSALSGHIADSVTQIMTTKSYAQEHKEITMFDSKADHALIKRKLSWLYYAHFSLIQAIFLGIINFIILYILIKQWETNAISIGDFVFFQAYIAALYKYVWGVGDSLQQLFILMADASEMADILYQAPTVFDKEYATNLKVTKGEIRLEDVFFRYGENGAHHVEDLSLTIGSGKAIGLVGPTGAGKTTIVKLIMRFMDSSRGTISIDGQDITNVTQQSLRSQISLVSQQPELFHRSLFENIAYARPEANKEEIINAAKMAHAHEFIMATELGYDTLVGERGVKLSGGERQRVALARAFLADRPILILDEATSALDSVTEKQIQQSIVELLKGRTAIVIAHRLSTIMSLDEIVVLQNGSIVERGTHNDLLTLNGLYNELWSHQSGGYLAE